MQSNPEILSNLYDLLGELIGSPRDLDEHTDLVSELGLTSLKIMDLLMEIEDRFDVTVPLNRLPEVRTIGDMASLLERLLSGAPS